MIQKGYLTHLNLHHFEEIIEDRGDFIVIKLGQGKKNNVKFFTQYLGLGPKSSALDKPKQNLSWNIMEPTDHGRKKTLYPHYSVVARLVPNVPVLLYIYICFFYYIFTIYLLYMYYIYTVYILLK
jgi:hypothetical protein